MLSTVLHLQHSKHMNNFEGNAYTWSRCLHACIEECHEGQEQNVQSQQQVSIVSVQTKPYSIDNIINYTKKNGLTFKCYIIYMRYGYRLLL